MPITVFAQPQVDPLESVSSGLLLVETATSKQSKRCPFRRRCRRRRR